MLAILGTMQWQEVDNKLSKEFSFADFDNAMRFVTSVADIAETLEHHPDISLHDYNRVTISTTTHDVGALTAADRALADAIDALYTKEY